MLASSSWKRPRRRAWQSHDGGAAGCEQTAGAHQGQESDEGTGERETERKGEEGRGRERKRDEGRGRERGLEASRQLERTHGDQGDPGHRQRDGCCRRAAARPAGRWPRHSRATRWTTLRCCGLDSLNSFVVTTSWLQPRTTSHEQYHFLHKSYLGSGSRQAGIMDSTFTSLHRNVVLLDLVDETWAADYLSDDGAPRARSRSAKCERA